MSTTEVDDPVTTPAPGRAMSLPVVAVLACAILLSLLGLQLALKLPGGQGIEDLLGWTHPDAVAAALSHWRGLSMLPPGSPAPQRWHVEAAYLLVDTGLFMPVYAVLLLMGAHALHTELQSDDALPGRSELGDWLRRGYFTATAVGVALLLVVDAVENHGGAVRIGVPGWLFSGCLVAGAVFGVAMWTAATHARVEVRRAAWWWLVLAFVVGALLVRATVAGTQTRWARISAQVRDALAAKSMAGETVERVVAVFVPFVLLLAAASAWTRGLRGSADEALLAGLAVLVVACPCSLGLAAPLAHALAIAQAAQRGILVRGGGVLEKLARLRGVAFDKTGTLTAAALQPERLAADFHRPAYTLPD